jgi:hypothetical protein
VPVAKEEMTVTKSRKSFDCWLEFKAMVIQLCDVDHTTIMDVCQTLDILIDRWCERRALRPLQLLFRAYPGTLLHTDQKFELLEAMKDVKGLCRAELPDDELQMLIEALQALEDSLQNRSS